MERMVVPKNLSNKHKPVFKTFDRMDVFGYLLPAITIIIVLVAILILTQIINLIDAVIIIIVFVALILTGLFKVNHQRLYLLFFWVVSWLFSGKRKQTDFFKEILNVNETHIKDNVIAKKSESGNIYKEIYELHADSIDFLLDLKQVSTINKFTDFFRLLNANVSFYSIPVNPDYRSQIDWMVNNFEKTYKSNETNIVKTAKLNELEVFNNAFCKTEKSIRARIFMVFHSANENNKFSINLLKQAGVNVTKVRSEKVLELLSKQFNFVDFFENNQKFNFQGTEIKFNLNSFTVSRRENKKIIKNYGRLFSIVNLPDEVGYTWLADLFSNNNVAYCFKIKPLETKKAQKQIGIGLVNASVDYQHAKTEFEKEKNLKEYEILSEQIKSCVSDNDRLFRISLIGMIYETDSLKNLTKKSKDVFSKIHLKNYELDALIGQQKNAYLSFNKQSDYVSKSNDIFIGTKALGYSYPFVNDNIVNTTGYYLGVNITNDPVIVDFAKFNNYKEDDIRNSSNGIVLGATGSGKSYFLKKKIKNKILADNWEVNVIDPDGEYHTLVKNLNGKLYKMTEFTINPFDIWIPLSDNDFFNFKYVWTEHINKLNGFFYNLFPELTDYHKSTLSDLILDIYKAKKFDYQKVLRIENLKFKAPQLKDLYDSINVKVNSKKTNFDLEILKDLLVCLKPYVYDGIYSHLWDGETNLAVTGSKLNVFEIKDLLYLENANIVSSQFFLLIQFLKHRIFENRKVQEKRVAQGLLPNRFVSVIVDEFHMITKKNSQLIRYLDILYATIRKYFGDIWTVSQDLNDWKSIQALNSSEKIINQSIFKFIFRVDENALDNINDLFKYSGGLSETEMLSIIDASQGDALLIYGQKRMLFSAIADQNFEAKLWQEELDDKKYELHFADLDAETEQAEPLKSETNNKSNKLKPKEVN